MIRVNIINKSTPKFELPKYETKSSAGMDLRANLGDTTIMLKPLKRAIIPTGIFIELPEGCEAQIRPRSGLAAKYGISIVNSPGTIDTDYLGEIKIILINLGEEVFTVNHGDRIAQMVFNKFKTAKLHEVETFEKITERGSGGFGHTGH